MTINRYIKDTSIFISFALLISCLTPIDFPVENAGGRLVVSGQISNIKEQNIIQLGTTADIARLPFPISDAVIKLLEEGGNTFYYLEDKSNPGIYTLPDFAGIPGNVYSVEITTPNGAVYTSTPEKMPEGTELNSVFHEIVEEEILDSRGIFTTDYFLKIYANSTFSNAGDTYIKWQVEEAFILSPTDFPDPFGSIPPPCFVVQNADPQRVVQFDGSTIHKNSIENQLVASRLIDWTFLEKHYFTTYQASITKKAFDYWTKVNILANQVGSIFDTPPAEITGNIINPKNPNEKPLGYFQVVNETYRRFYLFESDLPIRILNGKCNFDGNFDTRHYPSRCITCTDVRNSSYKEPDWF